MFGFFNITGEDSLQKNKSGDEPCFGGTASRLAYEQCKNPRGTSPAKAVVSVLMCGFFGIVGMGAGILLYDFVNENSQLYYPSEASTEHSSPSVEQLSVSAPAAPGFFEAVTHEQSKLYRIPRGVMLCAELDGETMLIPGDIIVALDGKEITEVSQLDGFPGDEGYTVRIFRKNKYIDITVSGELPPPQQ